jgi:hypothetical protein
MNIAASVKFKKCLLLIGRNEPPIPSQMKVITDLVVDGRRCGVVVGLPVEEVVELVHHLSQ